MPPFTLLLITTLVLVLFVFMLTSFALRIVPEYRRLVVFRLGRAACRRGASLEPSQVGFALEWQRMSDSYRMKA